MLRQEIIKKAQAHLGQRKLFLFAWCARFVSLVYDEAKLSKYWYGGKTSLSCTNVLNWYRKNYPDCVHTNLDAMRPGDVILYNFKNNGKPNHMGIFKSRVQNSSKFYAIEGNTSGPSGGSEYNGDTVALKCRSMSKVFAFIHVVLPNENPWPEPDRTLSRGCKGNDVKWLQYYLSISEDGNFGPKTEQALKREQSALNIEIDGKCGKQTRTALKGKYEHDY